MKFKLKSYFPKAISNKQSSDTGMAIVLILLLIGIFNEQNTYYKISIFVLIINMIYPRFFYVFAIIWFGLSKLLGTVVSKIILLIIYTTMIIPVGILRKSLGKDSLKLSEFKKDSKSVMISRNIYFTSKDIEKPY
jgi:hypothetical protein